MAVTTRVQREWARLGAQARLAELQQERAAILKVYPELARGSSRPAAAGTTDFKTPRRFSAAARRRMSAGMRKYWARRKAAAASKS